MAGDPSLRQKRAALSLFMLVILLLPSAVMGVSGSAGAAAGHNTAPEIQPVAPDSIAARETGLPTRPTIITLKPTPVPAKQNRTPLLPAAAVNAVERPRVVVPAFLFIITIILIIAALGIILYLLLRRTPPVPEIGDRPIRQENAGRPTIAGAPPQAPIPAAAGPDVAFPPSLTKRFLNPEFVGEGGLARVFRARNARTGRTVAVKVPARFDEVTGTHFTRDISLWQGLEHENIIRIYSSNVLPVPYIEMEYAPASLAATPLPVPEERAVAIALAIAQGLAYAHSRGIVHRDIKPENILLAEDGTAKITDWGLGTTMGDSRTSSLIGFSPAYAAPEQLAPHLYGKPGPATDIYQMGMLLAEILTGSPVFRGEGLHDLNVAILNETPVIPPWNGRHERELLTIIRKCLAKKPEDRYSSVPDLIRDLEALHG